MIWTGVAGQQLKRLKTERRYVAFERAECRFFFYVPKVRTRAKMQIAASDRAGRGNVPEHIHFMERPNKLLAAGSVCGAVWIVLY